MRARFEAVPHRGMIAQILVCAMSFAHSSLKLRPLCWTIRPRGMRRLLASTPGIAADLSGDAGTGCGGIRGLSDAQQAGGTTSRRKSPRIRC